jgi:hypothetical protein
LKNKPLRFGFFTFGLHTLELSEGFGSILIRQDPQALVHLLKQATELLRKALIDH